MKRMIRKYFTALTYLPFDRRITSLARISNCLPVNKLSEICQHFQSSPSQLPACCGILGPPEGLLMIILSTLRTELAASVARRIAHVFAASES